MIIDIDENSNIDIVNIAHRFLDWNQMQTDECDEKRQSQI
jgi:hypothetical protein